MMTYLNNEGGTGKKQHPYKYTNTQLQREGRIFNSVIDNALKMQYENPGPLLTPVAKT